MIKIINSIEIPCCDICGKFSKSYVENDGKLFCPVCIEVSLSSLLK
jgi:hypothetical protein